MTIRINLRALLRFRCWLVGHDWKDYLVVHPVWTPEGRYCPTCGKQQLVTWSIEFKDGETIRVRTDWNGPKRFTYVQHGSGSLNDPIRLEQEPR